MLPELKAAHPGVAFVDVQHNDMPNGLIGGAVEASASLDKHVVVSTRIAEALARRGVPRQKIALIANGVDTDLFRPPAERSHARVALGIDPKALVLAFVGRFSAEKRVQAYAQIVSLVREKLPVRGFAVGEGEDKPILQALIAAQDLPIEVLEPMERSQLRTIYAAADVLVLPSEVEGMPMAVLEAMATGCPVAVTDVGDVRRIIEQGTSGFIAPVEAPERLAEMIVEAARERGRLDSMRAAARQAVVSSGTTSWAMQQQYQELLASVAAVQA
jgi:glycosyltransferase involved in cell wall biosynthesis